MFATGVRRSSQRNWVWGSGYTPLEIFDADSHVGDPIAL